MKRNKNQAEKKEPLDLLKTVPFIRVEYKISEDGLVTLLVPKRQSELVKRLFGQKKTEFVRVDLDEIGSRAWKLINGKRTVGEITELLQAEKAIEQAEARMQLFIRALSARKYVDLFIVDKEDGQEV